MLPNYFLKSVVLLSIATKRSFTMSEIEETLERIKNHKGVEGYVIVDEVNGEVLRRYPGMAAEQAEEYAKQVKKLNLKAAHVIRDLDPSDELAYLRIRCQKHELLVAPGDTYNVIVIQRWAPASN